MAEPGTERPAVVPSPVQIVSTQDVAGLVEHCDATIARLEAEVAAAENAVTEAEARLRDHPAATIAGEDFERYVRSGVERHLAEVQRGSAGAARPVVTPTGPPQADPPAPGAPVAGEPETDPSGPSREADATPVDRGTDVATRAQRRAGRRRGSTTVVTRGTPAPPSASPPPADATRPIPLTAPVVEPAPVSEPAPAIAPASAAEVDDSAEQAFWGTDVDASGGTLAVAPARWPANLLVQLGVVLVIFAMILLKLG